MKPRILAEGLPARVVCGHCPFVATVKSRESLEMVIEAGAVCMGCRLWLCPRCCGDVRPARERPQFLN